MPTIIDASKLTVLTITPPRTLPRVRPEAEATENKAKLGRYAMRVPKGAPQVSGTAPLYGIQFAALLLVVFLGFASFSLVQPILPVLILEQGGDASTVGLVMLVFAVPSMLLRPFIGSLVDHWSRARTFMLGTTGLGLAGFLYLMPGLGPIFATRVLHGASWAAFNTAGSSTLAEIAPVLRRAEAAGIYTLVPNLAQMIGPAAALLLLGAYGFAGPFVAAGALGIAGTLVLLSGALPERQEGVRTHTGGFWRGLIERNALLPMTIEFLWISGQTLFVTYPPVFADEQAIPLEQLAIYYPVMGGVLIITRLIVRRHLDRYPRHLVLSTGISIGIVALGVAAIASDLPGLLLAACIFAIGSCATSPLATAIAIDRADPARRGAAMATYSLGYQLGFGIGGAAWGVMIAAYGYPAPYLGASVGLVALLVLIAAKKDSLAGRSPAS
ncbi:MAG: MFS transporter [Candidatus Limnocylindria bacterium]